MASRLPPLSGGPEALVVPRESWGTLVVTGPDRHSWLNGLVTCDVSKLQPGQAVWGLVLTRTGKIESEIQVLCERDRLLIATAADTAAPLAATLERMLIMEDAELSDASAEFSWFSIHGSESARVGALFGEALGASVATVEWLEREDQLLVCPRARAEEVRTLAAREATLARAEDWLSWRLERGLGAYGVDFTDHNNPHEASLERRAVSWTKGCYLGQEVVCMQEMRGKVRRRLKSLVIELEVPPTAGTSVLDPADQKVVGQLTSAAYSPRLGKCVALTMISNDYGVGTLVSVAGARATIVERPLDSSLGP